MSWLFVWGFFLTCGWDSTDRHNLTVNPANALYTPIQRKVSRIISTGPKKKGNNIFENMDIEILGTKFNTSAIH